MLICMANQYFHAITSYLKSLDFHFTDDWVNDCINRMRSTNLRMTIEELKCQVKRQWLCANLRDMKVPSLPPNLSSCNKTTLLGKYAVQVEIMIDSSQSCYSQLQRMQKVSTKNIETTEQPRENEMKPNRCLTFTLCDGIQEIQGMEYQPITILKKDNPELKPGFKMIILGPVICRKGMLLLTQANVRICGGGVESLFTSHSVESILCRRLNLQEQNEETRGIRLNQRDIATNEILNGSVNDINNSMNDNVTSLLSEDDDDLLLSLNLDTDFASEHVNKQVSQRTDLFSASNSSRTLPISSSQPRSSDFNEYDCEWNDTDFAETSDSIENRFCNADRNYQEGIASTSGNHPIVTSSVIKQKESLARMLCRETDSPIEMTKNKRIKIDSIQSTEGSKASSVFKKPAGIVPPFVNHSASSSKFKNDPSRGNMNTENRNAPVIISNEPFVYLKQIVELEISKPTLFVIKAVIRTLKTKIGIKDDQFTLKAVITDGSFSVDVCLSSHILEDILGFSPCEMVFMMKEKSRNSAIADRIRKAFQAAQEKLISINCLMKIQYLNRSSIPCVTSLEDINQTHLDLLKLRRSINS